MPWLRSGDTAANHPIALAALEHDDFDDRLLNEVFGFVMRCALQSTAHLTDYVVSRGTAIQMAGASRVGLLTDVAAFAGYWVEQRVVIDGAERTVYKLVEDPEFIHMRTKEEIEWERQRKSDNSNPALTVPVRFRDGDACRYCGKVVNFKARKGRLAGTYDHREPGKPATIDTYVVCCGACNAGRSNDPAADTAYPLLPAPIKPYYSPDTIEWFRGHEWAASNGYRPPRSPARTIAPGQPSGNDTSGQTAPAPPQTQGNGYSGPAQGNGTHGPQNGAEPRKQAEGKPPPPRPSGNLQIPADPADQQCASSGNSGTGRDGTGRVGEVRSGHPDQPPSKPAPSSKPPKRRRNRTRPHRRGNSS